MAVRRGGWGEVADGCSAVRSFHAGRGGLVGLSPNNVHVGDSIVLHT